MQIASGRCPEVHIANIGCLTLHAFHADMVMHVPSLCQVLTPAMLLDISGDTLRSTAFAVHSKARPARVKAADSAPFTAAADPTAYLEQAVQPAIVLSRPGALRDRHASFSPGRMGGTLVPACLTMAQI